MKKTSSTSQPPSPLLSLRSHGMVTAIGTSAPQTIASWVAETRRMRRIALDGFADPFTIADCHAVTAGLSGVARLAPLLASAVAEALEALDLDDPAGPRGDDECLEILVAPAWLAEEACEQLDTLLSGAVLAHCAWSQRTRSRLIVQGGAAGAWIALEHAYRAMAHNPRLRHVLIAAADSGCDPAVLRQAAQDDWLFRTGNAQGHVAGEAAACLLLRRVRDITEVPAGGFALHRPALVRAPQRLWPATGEPNAAPLSQALASALHLCAMQAQHISHLESDMDGSDWRAHMESGALNRVIFSATTALPHWRPATLLGQTGTPAGIVSWLLPALLHRHGYERINTVLNWSIDAAGDIAACVLERSPH